MGSIMKVDVRASRPPNHAQQALSDVSEVPPCILTHLNDGPIGPYKVVRWLKRRRRKVVVEIEAVAPSNGHTLPRYIVKLNRRDRTQRSYQALSQLWKAGFRPPSPYTVVRPVAYLADRGLLVQEKVLGRLVLDVILDGGDGVTKAVGSTAGWLAALHTSAVREAVRRAQLLSAAARYGKDLAQLLPRQASRIKLLVASALEGLYSPRQSSLVPSHGDFHPKNVFICDDGRITAIDFDTFGQQEPAADVAYFLAQAAIMGYFHRGSWRVTAPARECFLRAYEKAASPMPGDRLALYLGIAFLQSLHYELCVLRNGRTAIIEPWLANSESCLLDGKAMLI